MWPVVCFMGLGNSDSYCFWVWSRFGNWERVFLCLHNFFNFFYNLYLFRGSVIWMRILGSEFVLQSFPSGVIPAVRSILWSRVTATLLLSFVSDWIDDFIYFSSLSLSLISLSIISLSLTFTSCFNSPLNKPTHAIIPHFRVSMSSSWACYDWWGYRFFFFFWLN